MNGIERFGLLIFVNLAILTDIWLATSRCAFSPPVHVTALTLGALLQTTSVAIPLIAYHYMRDQTAGYRLRTFLLGGLVCLMSLPVMEAAILYGDSVGKEKTFRSTGLQCTTAAVYLRR